MTIKSALLTAGLFSFLYATAGMAAPIQIDFQGFVNGDRVGSIDGVRHLRVRAGQFEFDVLNDGGVYWDDTLRAFCIDVTTDLDTHSASYNLVAAGSSSYLNANQLSLIGQLYDGHAADLGNAGTDAAFQLALWEIIYDYNGALALNSDNFLATSGFSGARGTAQHWLDGLSVAPGYSSSYDFFVLDGHVPEVNQTLLVARQAKVPEPAAAALFALALALLGGVCLRSARTDA